MADIAGKTTHPVNALAPDEEPPAAPLVSSADAPRGTGALVVQRKARDEQGYSFCGTGNFSLGLLSKAESHAVLVAFSA